MFLRLREKDNKAALAEAYRDGRGRPRQRTLMTFGNIYRDGGRSFAFGLLWARKRYRMADAEWTVIVAKARPLLDQQLLRYVDGPVEEYDMPSRGCIIGHVTPPGDDYVI